MKYKIILLFLLTIHFQAMAQFGEPYRNSKVVLKNGETLYGIGKTKNKGFKFKAEGESDASFIEFSTIDFIQQEFSSDEKKVFRFFQISNDENFIKLEELVNGQHVSLYADIYSVYSGGGLGGMSTSQTVVKYYIKRKTESKVTLLGPYSPLINNLKGKVVNYFSDCASLIQKIEDKDFRMRNGLEQIVDFYNKNCHKN